MKAPILRPVAEHGLLVDYGDRFDRAIWARLIDLDARLSSETVPGFVEAVPAASSLLVRFDPMTTDHASVGAALLVLLAASPGEEQRHTRAHVVDVCYDGTLAPDLEEVATRCGMSTEDVVNAHLNSECHVQMYGFAPGYAYLTGLPAPLHLPRKTAAKRDVPKGSVLIAGPQCLVSTLTMPTGWWIIGRSPTAILTGDETQPFLFDVGDKVTFRRISRDDYDRCRT